MQPSVTNAKIGWLPRKVKGCVRTALNQANPGLLLINVPKRLWSWGARHRKGVRRKWASFLCFPTACYAVG